MDDYEHVEIGGFTYSIPKETRPRKKPPPYVVVMNDQCTACSGSPMCQPQCPVDCIHLMYTRNGRPDRVYVDNDTCIGCMNCFSYEIRPKHISKGDQGENLERYNGMDLREKRGVCPWDAIEIHPFEEGVKRSGQFYQQPRKAVRSVSEKKERLRSE